MHITILAYGSRGDVQPYVALGVGLRRAGHTVRLAAPEPFESFVTEYGLEFAPLPGDPAQLMQKMVEEAGASLFRLVPVILECVSRACRKLRRARKHPNPHVGVQE